jgi:hypothetical protein
MENNSKNCTKCNILQTLDNYYLRNGKYYPQCKECVKKQNKEYRQKLKQQIQKTDEPVQQKEEMDEPFDIDNCKTCSKCGKTKTININNFYYRNEKPLSQCRKCMNKVKAEYKKNKRIENRQEQIETGKLKVPQNPDNIICNGCKEEKDKSNFRINRKKCLDCERKHGREYRQTEKGKEKSKNWVKENSDKMSKLQAKWYQDNKEKRNEQWRERYSIDLIFKLHYSCKSRINKALHKKNLHKSNRTIEYLNCSIQFLIRWYEKCMTGDMTIDNHGKLWHIDHVIPINKFDLTNENEIILCFSWYNTMPLLGSENLSKHDNIVKTQIQAHKDKLTIFEKELTENDPKIPQEYYNLCARHLN